jgi:hypothetical protein
MQEKKNPWLDEGSRYDQDEKKKQNVRDLKFQDNSSHNIRVLPSKKPGEFPFFGYKQHWIPQNNTTTGRPVTHGIDERCPVCEWLSVQWDEVHRLKDEEDMTDKSPEVKAILDKISKVSAKTRYDMNVIHREDLYEISEETKEKVAMPKRMSAGATIYKEIFSFAKKWGSPSNEDTGYDLEIETTGSKDRREYRIIPNRDASPLTSDEKELIGKTYNLKELRRYSTVAEIEKVLENAKTPYNEILQYVEKDVSENTGDDNTVEEVEKEIDETVRKSSTSKRNKKQEKIQETESEAESNTNEAESDTNEAESDTNEAEETQSDEEHNIEAYECKGDFDETDSACVDCPVKSKCEEIHPFYVKAKQLKIDVDPHRISKDVIEDVKNKEKPQATESKRGKMIPF